MSEKSTPSLAFTLFCDDVRQEVGGKISLMGLFERIYAVQFPVVHPRMVIVQEWTDGKGEFEARTSVLAPDRTVLRETTSRINLSDLHFRQRDLSVHLNIEFRAAGTYWIETRLDGTLISSLPLNVVQVRESAVH